MRSKLFRASRLKTSSRHETRLTQDSGGGSAAPGLASSAVRATLQVAHSVPRAARMTEFAARGIEWVIRGIERVIRAAELMARAIGLSPAASSE